MRKTMIKQLAIVLAITMLGTLSQLNSFTWNSSTPQVIVAADDTTLLSAKYKISPQVLARIATSLSQLQDSVGIVTSDLVINKKPQDLTIADLLHLKSIDLSGVGAANLGNLSFLNDAKNMQILNLANNGLDDGSLRDANGASFSINQLSSIKKIDLSNNNLNGGFLNAGDTWTGQATTLIMLDISHNQINAFGGSVFQKFPNLQILNVSYNKLTSLPALTDFSDKLNIVMAGNNQLTQIADWVVKNPQSVFVFDAPNNAFTYIDPKVMESSSALEFLNISGNKTAVQIGGTTIQANQIDNQVNVDKSSATAGTQVALAEADPDIMNTIKNDPQNVMTAQYYTMKKMAVDSALTVATKKDTPENKLITYTNTLKDQLAKSNLSWLLDNPSEIGNNQAVYNAAVAVANAATAALDNDVQVAKKNSDDFYTEFAKWNGSMEEAIQALEDRLATDPTDTTIQAQVDIAKALAKNANSNMPTDVSLYYSISQESALFAQTVYYTKTINAVEVAEAQLAQLNVDMSSTSNPVLTAALQAQKDKLQALVDRLKDELKSPPTQDPYMGPNDYFATIVQVREAVQEAGIDYATLKTISDVVDKLNDLQNYTDDVDPDLINKTVNDIVNAGDDNIKNVGDSDWNDNVSGPDLGGIIDDFKDQGGIIDDPGELMLNAVTPLLFGTQMLSLSDKTYNSAQNFVVTVADTREAKGELSLGITQVSQFKDANGHVLTGAQLKLGVGKITSSGQVNGQTGAIALAPGCQSKLVLTGDSPKADYQISIPASLCVPGTTDKVINSQYSTTIQWNVTAGPSDNAQ